MSLSLGPNPTARQAGVSFTCHRATAKSFNAHHSACDGRSYTTSITDRGTPCQCPCHPEERTPCVPAPE